MCYEDEYGCAESMPCRINPAISCYDSCCEGCPVWMQACREDASQYEEDEESLPYDPYAWMY